VFGAEHHATAGAGIEQRTHLAQISTPTDASAQPEV